MSRNTQAWRSWWLAPNPPIAPGEAVTIAAGFLLPHALAIGPRADVDRILEHAGDRAIIFGRDEQDAVGRGDLARESASIAAGGLRLEILVVERQVADLDDVAVEPVVGACAQIDLRDLAVDAVLAQRADEIAMLMFVHGLQAIGAGTFPSGVSP